MKTTKIALVLVASITAGVALAHSGATGIVERTHGRDGRDAEGRKGRHTDHARASRV